MHYLKNRWDYWKLVFIPILIFFFLIYIAFRPEINPPIMLNFFKAIKDQTIYPILDKKINNFLNSQNLHFMINYFALLVNYLSIVNIYVVLIFTISTLISKHPILFISNLYLKINSYFLKFIADFKQSLPIVIFISIPFLLLLSTHNAMIAIIIISIIISWLLSFILRKKSPYFNWFFQKWLWKNLVITIMLIYTISAQVIDFKNHSKLWLPLFLNLYPFISLLMLTFYMVIFLIKIEFIQAKKHKEFLYEFSSYLSFPKIIENENKEDVSKLVDTIKNKDIFHSKFNQMTQKGDIIKDRNVINLTISSFCTFIMIAIVLYQLYSPSSNETIDEATLKIIVFFIVILLTRLLSRSYEIIMAFTSDVLSQAPKKSNLTGSDRIKLILKSLLEITVLSFGLKILYLIFLDPLSLPYTSLSIKDTLLRFFETYAIQLFNVSFDRKFGLFFAIIHIIQISVSASLILLSLAIYSGGKSNQRMYELKIENGEYIFSEINVINNKAFTRTIYSKKDFKSFQDDWENNCIDSEMFEQIQIAYQELQENNAKYQKQTEDIIQIFDNYNKIERFFKKILGLV
ncbi:hypothetical protein [Bacillus ndiopicus]|uniref:hypothetical protein n=1 Tax=Bacillus ndiopicus TaxID=1347368 RepID=UPI0018A852B9|nr:hypothetical protein [Bacillus ndiopicus]